MKLVDDVVIAEIVCEGIYIEAIIYVNFHYVDESLIV